MCEFLSESVVVWTSATDKNHVVVALLFSAQTYIKDRTLELSAVYKMYSVLTYPLTVSSLQVL